jgi:hypothetical protein
MKKMMEKLLNIENQIEIIEKPKIRFDNEIILQKLGNINLDKLNEILGEVDGVDNKKVSKMKETTKKPFIKRAGSANKKKRKKAKEEDCEKAVLTGRSFFPAGDKHLEIAKKRSIFAIYRDREINTQTQEEIDRKTHKNSYERLLPFGKQYQFNKHINHHISNRFQYHWLKDINSNHKNYNNKLV